MVSRYETVGAGKAEGGWSRIRSNAVNGNLRRAQLSFLGAWTAEWAFTVGLGIVAYREGGATAVGPTPRTADTSTRTRSRQLARRELGFRSCLTLAAGPRPGS
jgi:hypothetical protein